MCVHANDAASTYKPLRVGCRRGESVETAAAATTLPATGFVSDSAGASSVLWPLAVHATVLYASPQNTPPAKPTPGSSHPELPKPVATEASRTDGVLATRSPLLMAGGAGRLRRPTVGRSPSASTQATSVQRVVGQLPGLPRCLILRPVTSTVLATSVGRGLNVQVRSGGDGDSRLVVPAAVHTSGRQLLMPRVIPRAVPASLTVVRPASATIQPRTVVITQRPPPLATPAAAASSQSAPAVVVEETGRVSPLSCIQTLVANAGAASAQWVAIDTKTVDLAGSAVDLSESAAIDNDDPEDDVATGDKQASCVVRKRCLSMDEKLPSKIPKMRESDNDNGK